MPRTRATTTPKRRRPPTPPRGPPAKKRKVSRPTKIKRAKAAVSRDILTDQFDKRVDYVHVKKRVNSSAVNFKKKVQAVFQTQMPYITKLYTVPSASTGTTTGVEQAWQIFHLKPWAGQAAVPGAGTLFNEQAQNDLNDIFVELSAGGGTGALSESYWIKSAIMDIHVENTGATDVLLEVYELDYVMRTGTPINQYASFNAALTAAIAGTTTLGTAYSLNTRGVTPFDIVELLRTFGVRVTKKMSSDLQSNGRFAYTVKDYRRQYVNSDSIQKDLTSKFCIQNMTKSLLVIAKPYHDATASFRASADKHYRIQPLPEQQADTRGGQN